MDWQTPVALLCVLLAALALLRPLWSKRKNAPPHCGSGCGSCPVSKDGTRGEELVTLTGKREGVRDQDSGVREEI